LPSEIFSQAYGVTSQRPSVAYTVLRLHLPSVSSQLPVSALSALSLTVQ
jgi:hypothetical protein